MIFSHTRSHQVRLTIQAVAVGLSTGIVFLQFVCAIFYQIYAMYCSSKEGRNPPVVGINEEQIDAILDISGQRKDPRHFAERQPLLQPDQVDSDVPIY